MPPPQFRHYVLAKEFGFTLDEIDAQPAARLDWLIACHNTVEGFKADKQREASRE